MKPTIVTHNARFHSDDIFAVAVLLEMLGGEATIVRSRDPAVIERGDYVLDVGGLDDPSKNRFDHHQPGGAGKRPNGIPYASFGLVWKKFGEKVAGGAAVAEAIDRKLVQSIDAMDNGVDLSNPRIEGVFPYMIQSIAFSFGPTWKEDPESVDGAFLEMVAFARKILKREIRQAADGIEASVFVEAAYAAASDKRIIILDGYYPWSDTLIKYSEPLYVIRPNVQSDTWKVEAMPVRPMNYEVRKKFPEAWAGKRDGELAAVTGVADATFCHNARFLTVSKTREGAIKLAQIAAAA